MRLAEHYGAPHISTGDMLRAAAAEGSDIGMRAKAIMDAGSLMPDDVMMEVVADRLAHADARAGGFLLDGFPRTIGQAEALLGLATVDAAVNLDVPELVVRERMLGRARADDTPEAIDNRLGIYVAETMPVVQWFDEHGLLLTVDGLGTEDEVFDRLVVAIDAGLAAT